MPKFLFNCLVLFTISHSAIAAPEWFRVPKNLTFRVGSCLVLIVGLSIPLADLGNLLNLTRVGDQTDARSIAMFHSWRAILAPDFPKPASLGADERSEMFDVFAYEFVRKQIPFRIDLRSLKEHLDRLRPLREVSEELEKIPTDFEELALYVGHQKDSGGKLTYNKNMVDCDARIQGQIMTIERVFKKHFADRFDTQIDQKNNLSARELYRELTK